MSCRCAPSGDRNDYIAHPGTGETLSPQSQAALEALRASWGGNPPKGQIVISDGLNAKAIMDQGHLAPYLEEMRRLLADADVPMSETNILVTSGRVRVGYRIGETLFAGRIPTAFEASSTSSASGRAPCTTPIRLHHGGERQGLGGEGGRSRHHEAGEQHRRCPVPKEAARETLTIIREVVGKNVSGSRRVGT